MASALYVDDSQLFLEVRKIMYKVVHSVRLAMAAIGVFLLYSCATQPQIDYTAFRESRPRSILVMPPVNWSSDAGAATTFLATSTIPLAEAGYYVIPVTLSDQTFKQNGVTVADEAHAIPPGRLREIFGADAALYITVTRYGRSSKVVSKVVRSESSTKLFDIFITATRYNTSFEVVSSGVRAEAFARLVDLRTGQELWSGNTVVEENINSGGNLAGQMLDAVVGQVVNTLTDRSYDVGKAANNKLLSAGNNGSVLYGPYHSMHKTD